MKFKSKAVAAILAAAILAAGLISSDLASAHQSRTELAHKRAVAVAAKKVSGDCTLYGSGCLNDWSAAQHGVDGNPATADVLVVGDSIVNICRPYLRLRLANYGLTVVFDYWSSRPTEDIPAVSSASGAVTKALTYSRLNGVGHFKAVDMATGTNNIFDPSVMTAQINRIKGIDAPLVWGTVYASRSASYSADLRNSGWVNQQITGSGLPVADWFGFLASYPGYRIGAYLLSDGVHPTRETTPALLDGSGCDAWAAIHAPRIAAVAA